MKITQLSRRTLTVEGVRVTLHNIEELAEWCEGTVEDDGRSKAIRLTIPRAKDPRFTKASVGDWIVRLPAGARVFSNKALRDNFVRDAEPACGKTDHTLDNGPCVLGEGHRNYEGVMVGCRSLSDYKLMIIDSGEI